MVMTPSNTLPGDAKNFRMRCPIEYRGGLFGRDDDVDPIPSGTTGAAGLGDGVTMRAALLLLFMAGWLEVSTSTCS